MSNLHWYNMYLRQLLAGARLAQSVGRKALNLVVVGLSPTGYVRQTLQAQTTCAVCTWSQQTSAFTLCRPSLYSAAQTTLLGCTLWLPHKPLAPGALAHASGPPSPHRYSCMPDFGTSLHPGNEMRATDLRRRFLICNKPA